MYFPSKKDAWLYPINWGCIIACFTPIFIGRDYEALFFTIPLGIFLCWSWFTTGYNINEDYLMIQYGPIKKNIPIKDIKSISQTKNFIAASALSIDRLEILYGVDFGTAIISPKDRRKFVAHLIDINPKIEMDKHL